MYKYYKQAINIIVMLILLRILAHLIFITPILFNYPMIIAVTVLCGISGSGIALGLFIINT